MSSCHFIILCFSSIGHSLWTHCFGSCNNPQNLTQQQPPFKKSHGKINLCSAFLKEVIQQCKDVLDDDAITDIIKSCNVIKNEKVQQAKRKVKGQAQKSKKADKAAAKKAMEIHDDVFGDNDNYDQYDEMGGAYEDDFFWDGGMVVAIVREMDGYTSNSVTSLKSLIVLLL